MGTPPGVRTLLGTRASSEGDTGGGRATPARRRAGPSGARPKPLSYVCLKGRRLAQGGLRREGGPGCPPSGGVTLLIYWQIERPWVMGPGPCLPRSGRFSGGREGQGALPPESRMPLKQA